MIDKIAALLLGEFSSVYCNSCAYSESFNEDQSPCEECHRKSMYWSLNEEVAESIATDIVNLIINELSNVLDKGDK